MEVIVNGEYIELGDSEPAITKKSIDINNPSTRFIDYTNKFEIPRTLENDRKLENPTAVGSNNRAFDKYYNVTIEDIFRIFSGKGYLDSSDFEKHYLQVVDNSKDLFNELNIKLNKILWDDYDTILTQADIDAQDTLDIDNCWIWGKACYHQSSFIANTDQTTGDNRCKYSRPAFSVTSLLRRAIIQAGYTFEIPDINLAINANTKQFFFTSYQKTFNQSFTPSGTLGITNFTSYDFKHADVTASTDNIIVLHKTVIRIRGHVTTDADITLRVHAHNIIDTKETENSFLLPRDGDIDFSTSQIYDSPSGMKAYFFLDGTGNVTFTDVLVHTDVEENTEDLSTNHWLDWKIKAYDNLPDLTYLDLFKLICIIGNKYQIVDNFKKEFSWGTLANLNKLNAVDWSEKFIIGSENITSQFSGLFQKNWLKYDNDITVSNELGWSYFLSDNESFASEGDYISLKFGASKDVNVNGNQIIHIPIYTDTGRDAEVDFSMRLAYINGDKLQFFQVSWEQIKENYYANWFNSLYRIRQIDAEFNLSKLDVLKWKPKQLIYIDYFETTFIVLEINNFIPGRKTKVKLLAYGR